MDRLALRGITAIGHHGVLDAERRSGQPFVVDVVMGLDTAPAAATDDLARTVDYAEIAGNVTGAIESDPVSLLETLAGRIADVCLQPAVVEWVEITVHKPQAPLAVSVSDVALTITRTRS